MNRSRGRWWLLFVYVCTTPPTPGSVQVTAMSPGAHSSPETSVWVAGSTPGGTAWDAVVTVFPANVSTKDTG
ncbi:MAG: hypothetical protein KC656_07560 [Myxococcales bacterium]|nr:hypothetical protein [Myxococcales bacterium]